MKQVLNKTVIIFTLSVISLGLVLLTLYKTQSGKRFLIWGIRKTFMSVLEYRQFSHFYEGRCLVENIYTNIDFDQDQCELCENTELLEINATMKDDVGDFIHLDIPVIVDNSVNPFEQDLPAFADLFLSNENLALFQPCQFKSNVKSKVAEHRQLLQMVSTRKVTSFYALWENCADMSLKAFRQFYERPQFLGSNIQLTGTNWALMCSNFETKTFKEIETFSKLETMLVQKGIVEIRLVPIQPCYHTCSTLSTYLSSGETLTFTGNLYTLSLRPVCNGVETLVIGVGGYLD